MENKNIKIAVYYIATGDYKKLFPGFLESLQNYFPEDEKVVKLISDGLEEYKGYVNGKVRVDLCPRINDYPWPIVTLYKMWHILENFDESCDYFCYFNGNAIIHPHYPDVFDMTKITTSYHSFNTNKYEFNIWDNIQLDPKSRAYLENKTYGYVQGAFFGGPKELFRQLCDEVTQMVKYDTNRFMFAQWHDESYLNKWCVEHEDLVDRKYVLAYYEDEIDKNRFVHLRDKRDLGINRK